MEGVAGARGLLLETTFLIDIEREAARRTPGPAHSFLEDHPDAALHTTWITAGEMACGPRVEQRAAWRKLVGRFRMLEPDEETCWAYGQTYRYLRANGLLIGANDLWIAAAALTADLPVVTRDEEHFRRVPGLRVEGYRQPPEG